MESSETEIAVFIFLGVFCVLCPLFVFLIWYFFGKDDEEALKEFEERNSKANSRRKRSDIAIVLEDTASDDDHDEEEYVFAEDPDGHLAASESMNGSADSSILDRIENNVTRKKPEIACPRELKANKGASMTASNQVATIDVHKCTSSQCEHCRITRTTQFVPAEPLEATTAHRIRYISSPWWEVGGSLREMTANISGAFASTPRQMKGNYTIDEGDDDDKSILSKWTWRRKRDPRRPKTPRVGSENV